MEWACGLPHSGPIDTARTCRSLTNHAHTVYGSNIKTYVPFRDDKEKGSPRFPGRALALTLRHPGIRQDHFTQLRTRNRWTCDITRLFKESILLNGAHVNQHAAALKSCSGDIANTTEIQPRSVGHLTMPHHRVRRDTQIVHTMLTHIDGLSFTAATSLLCTRKVL